MFTLYYQIQGKIQFKHLVTIVTQWLAGPGHRALQGFHRSHMHNHSNVRQVSLAHSEVERAKGL